MGSWNATDCITNLPIFSGESIYSFLLVEGASYDKYIGDHCYSDTYYQPLPLYFEGKYNDYGSVENCTGEYLDYLLNSIKEKLIEFDLGENEYHDIPVKKDKFDINLLLVADNKNRLFIESHKYEAERKIRQKRLTHIVTRKSVIESLIKNYKISFHSEKTNYREIQLSFEQAVRLELDNYPEIQESFEIILKIFKNGSEKTHTYSYIRGSETPLEWIHQAFSLKQHIINPGKLIYTFGQTKEEYEKLVRHLMVMVWLEHFHSRGRRVWIKPSGAGSQDDEVAAQVMAARLINQGVKEIRARDK